MCANVWKIGSRWSDNGLPESSIMSIFRRNNVVFIGNDTNDRFCREVRKGDYFAIADGYTVLAVARATSEPMRLSELIAQNAIKVRNGDNPEFELPEDYGVGVKVKIVDLPNELKFSYQKQGSFFMAKSIADKVRMLYDDNLKSKFDIKAKTCRLAASPSNEDDKTAIINGRTRYIIPIYQREYSWGEEQVARFIYDIFNGFRAKEPMFIGTMQLSYKKYISDKECEQDIIDGQQRLSTIVCILKYLSLKFPEVKTTIPEINWMETRVNNGKEEELLEEMLKLQNLKIIQQENQNRYVQNMAIIDECFENATLNDDGKLLPNFDIGKFVGYILHDIFFVVIETIAGLSKTIQVFNAINTAGLDLNGDDLFKVRLYEYLHDIKGRDEDAFREIGNIYKDVKERNTQWRKNHDWDLINIGLVRSVYKDYLISKYELRTEFYAKATDTFFDELFDVLLDVQNHQEIANAKSCVELSLKDLRRIIGVVCLWGESDYRNNDEFISYLLIERSRYSRYADIAYQILLSNEGKPDNERLKDVYDIMRLMGRVFFCWSIEFARQVSEVHTLMNNIYKWTFQKKKEKIRHEFKNWINRKNNDNFKYNTIGKPIADNRVWKDLICVLSGYLDEISKNTRLKDLKKKFEWGSYDIEHIHANANEEEGIDIDWELQNGIGNLMLLEPYINKSIGKLPFREKVNRADNKPCYKDSSYETVKKIMEKEQWGKCEVEARRKEEIRKISKFLFEDI